MKFTEPNPKKSKKSTNFPDLESTDFVANEINDGIDYTNSKPVTPYERDSDGNYVLRFKIDPLQTIIDVLSIQIRAYAENIYDCKAIVNNYTRVSRQTDFDPIKRRITMRRLKNLDYNVTDLFNEVSRIGDAPIGELMGEEEKYNISRLMESVGQCIIDISMLNSLIEAFKVVLNNPDLDITDILQYGLPESNNFATYNASLLNLDPNKDLVTSQLCIDSEGFGIYTKNEILAKEFKVKLTHPTILEVFNHFIEQGKLVRKDRIEHKELLIHAYNERFPRQ